MHTKHRLTMFAACVAMFATLIVTTHTTTAQVYQPLEPIPGAEDAARLPDYISGIYKFALWAVGIAAMFMITIGGGMYLTSAGNTSAMGNAKQVIEDAIIGLILALVAWFLLYVINPDILDGDLSIFESVGTITPSTVTSSSSSAPIETSGTTKTPLNSTGGTCTGTNSGCCKSGTQCVDCYNCTSFSNGYANLCYTGAPGNTGCKLNSTLADKLNKAGLSAVSAEVSEAWPPTVYHSADCHKNGTCADVRCSGGCSGLSVTDIKKIYDALKNAGLNPVFETYSGQCAKYTNAGVSCISPSTMTAPSFHVNM